MPPSAVSLEAADERMLADRLCDLRMRAEDRDVVPPSETSAGDLVERLLGELLGWRRHPPRREPGYDFAADGSSVGSACRAEPDSAEGHPSEDRLTERLGTEKWEERAGAPADRRNEVPLSIEVPPGRRDLQPANAAAIIDDISVEAAGEECEKIDATDVAARSYDDDLALSLAGGGANNSEVFSAEPVIGDSRPEEFVQQREANPRGPACVRRKMGSACVKSD